MIKMRFINIGMKGFSIIAVMVYLSLSTLLIALLMRAVTNLYPRLVGCSQYSAEYLKLCTAIDCIANDLYGAPHNSLQWLDATKEILRWKQGDKTVSWQYRNSKLVRIESTSLKNKKIKSIAADSLTECIFEQKKSGNHITGVTVKLLSKQAENSITLTRIIALRTGGKA